MNEPGRRLLEPLWALTLCECGRWWQVDPVKSGLSRTSDLTCLQCGPSAISGKTTLQRTGEVWKEVVTIRPEPEPRCPT